MANIFDQGIVQYACSCGSLKCLTRLYFCRHCEEIRCGYCVRFEVASYFCSYCLENLSSSEAKTGIFKCRTCMECPICFASAVVRVVTRAIPNSDDPNTSITEKKYYLACLHCHWSTRDSGTPDQDVASKCWNLKESAVHEKRVAELLEYYKALVSKDHLTDDKRKYNQRRNYGHLDKFNVLVIARNRASLSPKAVSVPKPAPSEASDQVEHLPEDIFTKPVILEKVSTLQQRLRNIESQPEVVTELVPSHKNLSVKQSLRCPSCEHSVIRPEFSPLSTAFKIRQFALLHVPEVRFVSGEVFGLGKASDIVITVSNPTLHQTTVKLLRLPTSEEEKQEVESMIKQKKRNPDEDKLPSYSSTNDSLSLSESSRECMIREYLYVVGPQVTADIVLPQSPVVLPAKVHAVEYDDTVETTKFTDATGVVVNRKGNKACIKMNVTPSRDDEVSTGFILEYDYVNTVQAGQTSNLKAKVYLNIGKVG